MLQHGNGAAPAGPVPAAPAAPVPPAAPPPGPPRRRFLTGAAGAATALAAPALLTGCGSDSAGSGGELTFWNFYGPQHGPDPAANRRPDWFVKTVDAGNATHSVKIRLQFVPQPLYLNGSKLPTAFAAGEG